MDSDIFQILAVDDNPEILEILQILLTGEGYAVTTAASGSEALSLLSLTEYDLIILDVMMPRLNGYQTCLEIRKKSNAPILFLSARTKDSDKTLGFSSGGDDYLAKPFSYSELTSRVRALLRRYRVYQGKQQQETPQKTLVFHDLRIEEDTKQVHLKNRRLELTDTEYAVLLLLIKNRPQIFSADRMYETIWNEPYYYGANNTVMVHIRNLRRKIEEDPKNPKIIKTIWGKGYYCD